MTPDMIERIRSSVQLAVGRPHARERRRTRVAVPPAGIAALIDHTLLKPDAPVTSIARLSEEAIEHGFASVCVNPYWVSACERRVRDSGVRVCAVTAFPLGASMPAVKAEEARLAVAEGAREIDMVMNIGALKSGDLRAVTADIEAVTAVCREYSALTKVILETALLTDEEKVIACVLSEAAGADYVKTSTGFGPGGATTADVALMHHVIGDVMGVKASGGIRDRSTLDALVAAGATRIGTSAGVDILRWGSSL